MPVVSTSQDPEALTLTVVSDLAAPPSHVWQLWSDPRMLERWWGPPTWPATFEQHDFTVGGRSSYSMTGPEGEKARGWWELVTLEEPRLIEFDDGFCDESGQPDPSMPTTRSRVELEASSAGTLMTITSTFANPEQMQQLSQMGMVEGITAAVGQIDELLVGA